MRTPGPTLSPLQAALMMGNSVGEDPSSRKKLEWEYDEELQGHNGQGELAATDEGKLQPTQVEGEATTHQADWVDELMLTKVGNQNLQEELNARCSKATRFEFFDDDEGEDWLQQEPDDLHIVCQMPQNHVIPDF